MPARPLSDTTLHLIVAVREALADCSDVQERRMFGCHVFMVDGKLCLGVEHDELLVRLPPSQHAAIAETPGVRPLSSRGQMDGYFYISPAAYATRTQWRHWIAEALAFNPQAKATPPRKRKAPAAETPSPPGTEPGTGTEAETRPGATPASRRTRKHPIFGDE